MQRFGLAFSGGGFRATLYHLGMIRFLREANILPSVQHITSVSGGSILAAHLVLNWDRYTGSLEDFEAAAAEVVRFVQMDVRNRIVRRYPLATGLWALQRLAMQRPQRRLTRAGLLEHHYEKFLYGDTCLFQLPERPRLFLLATNLSEGCLCAFTREGLLMQRRLPGQRFRFERVHAGLATIPMAVTASSAFPGFFPPLELSGEDIGADPGRFGRQAFTDGGVYDNLGVRMFRCMEQSWLAREVRLQREDLANVDEVGRALHLAAEAASDSPLRRLAQMIAMSRGSSNGRNGRHAETALTTAGPSAEGLLEGLWDVLNHENLAREPAFASLSSSDSEVAPLLRFAQGHSADLDAGEQIWLNRQLVDAAFRQAHGRPCFRSKNACYDAVLVSDAGKEFQIASDHRAGGLIATAIRSTDIIMDRVWKLEIDTFAGTPGFVFAPISRILDRDEDPTAPHPEVQRMTAEIRTDLDYFSPLEIRSLVQQGYCVGRATCRANPDLFGSDIPVGAPWDPMGSSRATEPQPQAPLPHAPHTPRGRPSAEPARETVDSRKLQASAHRRIWSTLLDFRDWTTYLYVPLLFPILVLLPYYGAKWYHQAQVAQRLLESMAQSNQDFGVLSKLLESGPVAPFEGQRVQEGAELAALENPGVEVIADTRVVDLRAWKGRQVESSWIYLYRRSRVKKALASGNEFVLRMRGSPTKAQLRALSPAIPTTVRAGQLATPGQDAQPMIDVVFDLSKQPVGEVIDLPYEYLSREPPEDIDRAANFHVDVDTPLLTCWMLLPEGKATQRRELLRFPVGSSSSPERVVPANEMVTPNGQIVGFTLVSVEPGYKYERRWTYQE